MNDAPLASAVEHYMRWAEKSFSCPVFPQAGAKLRAYKRGASASDALSLLALDLDTTRCVRYEAGDNRMVFVSTYDFLVWFGDKEHPFYRERMRTHRLVLPFDAWPDEFPQSPPENESLPDVER